jgi:hypothetical protein
MFGTFVPIHSGHLPIDFHQKIKYNCFNRQINKTPLHVEKGRLSLRAAERVGILSAAYKFPQGSGICTYCRTY